MKKLRVVLTVGIFLLNMLYLPPEQACQAALSAQKSSSGASNVQSYYTKDELFYKTWSGLFPQKVERKKILVALVDFKDKKGTFSPRDFENLFFSTNKRDDNNTGSLREYYRQASYNTFDVSGDVIGWYHAPNNYSYYAKRDQNGTQPNKYELYNWLFDEVEADVNFAKYDLNNDRTIDGLFVVHQGSCSQITGKKEDFKTVFSSYNKPLKLDGLKLEGVGFVPEKQGKKLTSMGLLAHEFGHLLGLPDLYDTDGTSYGVGNWDLMGHGNWLGRNSRGDSPAFLSAWSKNLLGWIKVKQLTESTENITVKSADKSNVIYKVGSGKEHFLIENRQEGIISSFDEKIPGSGLFVWHIDESQTTNNNETGRRLVALVPADGKFHLEHRKNVGDQGDVFKGKQVKLNYFNGSDSGFRLYNISQSGDKMTFSFANNATTVNINPISSKKVIGNNTIGSLNKFSSKLNNKLGNIAKPFNRKLNNFNKKIGQINTQITSSVRKIDSGLRSILGL